MDEFFVFIEADKSNVSNHLVRSLDIKLHLISLIHIDLNQNVSRFGLV